MENSHQIENLHGGIIVEHTKSDALNEEPQVHLHNYHELYFLLSGARQYFIEHTIYNVEPGELVIVPKNHLHCTTKHLSAGYDRYLIYCSDEFIKPVKALSASDEFDKIFNSGCISFSVSQSEKIKSLIISMEQELKSNDSYSRLIVAGKLNEIISYTLRHGKPKLYESEKTALRIQKVARYISENYTEAITLKDAAQRAYMDSSYFSRQFKKLTGLGFIEYLTEIRIKKATELVDNTTLSVNQIAEQCGFSSANYFRDVFRKHYNISPLEYRKKVSPTK